MSMNSPGRQGAAGPCSEVAVPRLHGSLLPGRRGRNLPTVLDREGRRPPDAGASTGRAGAADSSFLRIMNLLGQAKVIASPTERSTVSDLVDTARTLRGLARGRAVPMGRQHGGRLRRRGQGRQGRQLHDRRAAAGARVHARAGRGRGASWSLPALWRRSPFLLGALAVLAAADLVRWRVRPEFPA